MKVPIDHLFPWKSGQMDETVEDSFLAPRGPLAESRIGGGSCASRVRGPAPRAEFARRPLPIRRTQRGGAFSLPTLSGHTERVGGGVGSRRPHYRPRAERLPHFCCGSVRIVCRTVACTVSGLLVCATCGCLTGNPVGPGKTPTLVCPHAEPSRPFDDFDPQYRIVSPNGGEVFEVGQACSVQVTSKRAGNAMLLIVIGRHSFSIPGLDHSLVTPADSLVVFTMPDSFAMVEYDPIEQQNVTRSYASVTDSCLVRILDYQEENYTDYSDCYFAIRD